MARKSAIDKLYSVATDAQRTQLDLALAWRSRQPKNVRYYYLRKIKDLIEAKTDTYFVPRLRRMRALGQGSAPKLIYWVLLYGKRRAILAWEEYNKSRAVTKELCIKRHGDTSVFDLYREKQRTAGCSLQWFVDKYGESAGRDHWLRLNARKGHSIASYAERYGVDAEVKLAEYWESRSKFKISSQAEQEFVVRVSNLACFHGHRAVTQYGVYDREERKYRLYDLVFPDAKIAIEFHGDYWHANPERYAPSTVMYSNKTAPIIWEEDRKKQVCIKRERGFELIVVWESEYERDAESVMQRIESFVGERKTLHR